VIGAGWVEKVKWLKPTDGQFDNVKVKVRSAFVKTTADKNAKL
jgi:hypothetical protein